MMAKQFMMIYNDNLCKILRKEALNSRTARKKLIISAFNKMKRMMFEDATAS